MEIKEIITTLKTDPELETLIEGMESEAGEGGTLPFWPRLLRLIIRTVKDWGERDVGTYASSSAFFFFMSAIPLIILLIQLLLFLGMNQTDLLIFLTQLIPEEIMWLVTMVVREACEKASGLVLSASAVVLIWSASKGTMQFRRGLNRVYGEKEKRSYPVLCLIAIGYTAALIVIFAIILYLLFAGPLSQFLAAKLPEIFTDTIIVKLWQKFLLYGLMVLLFTMIYAFIPYGKRKFLRQIPGALFVTLLWELFSAAFSIYIRGYNAYTMFYGSLGAVAVVLFWLYCCFFILLIGGYMNRFVGIRWERIKKMIVERKPYE